MDHDPSIVEWVRATTKKSGVPEFVEDPNTLSKLATVIDQSAESDTAQQAAS